MDNPVERPHWNRLQVLLWICTRSSDAVRLAAHDLGSTSLLDFDENDPSHFGDEDELVGTAIINYGYIMSFGDAKRELIVAESKGQLRAYQDSGGAAFFERTGAMAIWPPGDMIESAEVEEPGKLCAEPAEPSSHGSSEPHGELAAPAPIPTSRSVSEAAIRNWLRTNSNAQRPERQGWPAAKEELRGEISRARYRNAR
jgi:hypothetical protein